MAERKLEKKLHFLLKGYDEGWLKYEPKEKKEIDFNKYTIAQVNEINNVLVLIKRIVDETLMRQMEKKKMHAQCIDVPRMNTEKLETIQKHQGCRVPPISILTNLLTQPCDALTKHEDPQKIR